MLKRKYILIIAALVLIMVLVSIIPIVSSQSTVAAQRWEYAIVIWDISKSEFSWNVSGLYDSLESEFPVGHDTIQVAWEMVADSEGSGLVDYLAVMGVSSYELVDVTNLQTSALVYTFKRPITN